MHSIILANGSLWVAIDKPREYYSTRWVSDMLRYWKTHTDPFSWLYSDIDSLAEIYQNILLQTLTIYNDEDKDVANIPEIYDLLKFAKSFLNTIPQFGECCICNEVTATRTTCGHFVHKECIEQWIIINPTCPMCRSIF